MKHKIWIHQLISALFAFVLAVSSVGNLITGYELPVMAMWKICLWCAFAAIAVAVLFQVPHGGKIMVGLTALGILGLCVAELYRPFLFKQIETLLYWLTSHYYAVYNWPLIGTDSVTDVSIPLVIWAILVAFCVNWYICKRKHIAVAIVPTVLPLVLCLLTADKVPHGAYLCLMIAGLAILLITDWTRRTQPDQGMKLTLWMSVPIVLAVAVLFACNPKESYVNYAGKIQKELSSWFQEARQVVIHVITGEPIDDSMKNKVNLRDIDAKNKSTRSVMIVNSPVEGKIYLRERDYDLYTGVAWEATQERTEQFTPGGTAVGTLTILTYSTRNYRFVPYYATSNVELAGGALENTDDLQQYSYKISLKSARKTSVPGPQYTELPAETKAWATELVKELTDGIKDKQEKILRIRNHIHNSARYSTIATRMDLSKNDFVKWFLEECETGYSVHYATAATVLLRAAGIPARYVEGYTADCVAGTDVAVSKKEAHAWVEYYDMTIRAWCVLEATPARDANTKPPATPEDTEPTEETIEDTKPQNQVIVKPQSGRNPIKIACYCLAVVLGLLLQAYLRIFRKRKLWNGGEPNARTIWRWRQTRRLANLLGQYYPEELDDLAKKARFSQHEMQPDELEKFEEYRLSIMDAIAEKPWYQRMFYKWILAID